MRQKPSLPRAEREAVTEGLRGIGLNTDGILGSRLSQP